MTEEVNEGWIEIVKDLYLKNSKVGLIPAFLFDVLEIDLSEEETTIIRNSTEERLYQDAAKAGTKALKEFAHLRNSPLYETVLKSEFKRQAVAHYFTRENEIDNF